MAIAVFSQSSIIQPITRDKLYLGIKQAFADVSFGSQYFEENNPSVDPARNVCKLVVDPTKTFGNIYLRLRVTNSLIVGYRIYSKYEEMGQLYENASNEYSSAAFSSTSNVELYRLDGGSEFKAIILIQGSNYYSIFWLVPQNKPSWWDLNQWNYGFIPLEASFSAFNSTFLNPYNNVGYSSDLANSRMSSANSITGKRDIQLGINLFTQSNRGIAAQTSEDLVMIAASQTGRFDIIKLPDNKEFLILNNIAGGLGCRIK